MKVYAFDVDECLEISNGPVKLISMMELRDQGHIIGIAGNWGLFCSRVESWQWLVSFLSVGLEKGEWLEHFKRYVIANEYIMVGNVFGEKNSLGFVCQSRDSEAAAKAGWRFIKEDDFANGVR